MSAARAGGAWSSEAHAALQALLASRSDHDAEQQRALRLVASWRWAVGGTAFARPEPFLAERDGVRRRKPRPGRAPSSPGRSVEYGVDDSGQVVLVSTRVDNLPVFAQFLRHTATEMTSVTYERQEGDEAWVAMSARRARYNQHRRLIDVAAWAPTNALFIETYRHEGDRIVEIAESRWEASGARGGERRWQLSWNDRTLAAITNEDGVVWHSRRKRELTPLLAAVETAMADDVAAELQVQPPAAPMWAAVIGYQEDGQWPDLLLGALHVASVAARQQLLDRARTASDWQEAWRIAEWPQPDLPIRWSDATRAALAALADAAAPDPDQARRVLRGVARRLNQALTPDTFVTVTVADFEPAGLHADLAATLTAGQQDRLRADGLLA